MTKPHHVSLSVVELALLAALPPTGQHAVAEAQNAIAKKTSSASGEIPQMLDVMTETALLRTAAV
jgi:hypothetical protein